MENVCVCGGGGRLELLWKIIRFDIVTCPSIKTFANGLQIDPVFSECII